MTQSNSLSNCVHYVANLVNFRKNEFGGSCGRGNRYGQLWQHSWQVCVARSARDDLALTSHDRSGHQLDSLRHPKLVKINGISLIFIDFH